MKRFESDEPTYHVLNTRSGGSVYAKPDDVFAIALAAINEERKFNGWDPLPSDSYPTETDKAIIGKLRVGQFSQQDVQIIVKRIE